MNRMGLVVQGVVSPDGTLQLDEKLNVPPGRVQVTVQPLPDLAGDPFWQRMEAIWAGQQARGHTPRTLKEIEDQRQSLQEELEQELQETMRLQNECRAARKKAGQVAEPNAI